MFVFLCVINSGGCMKISLNLIVALDAVNKFKTLSCAANKLCKTPSALSYQIKKAESILGVVILDRKQYRTTFTDMGRLILEDGLKVIKAARELEYKIEMSKFHGDRSLKVLISNRLPVILAKCFISSSRRLPVIEVIFYDSEDMINELDPDVVLSDRKESIMGFKMLHMLEGTMLLLSPEKAFSSVPYVSLRNEDVMCDASCHRNVVTSSFSDKWSLMQSLPASGAIPDILVNEFMKTNGFISKPTNLTYSYSVCHRESLRDEYIKHLIYIVNDLPRN